MGAASQSQSPAPAPNACEGPPNRPARCARLACLVIGLAPLAGCASLHPGPLRRAEIATAARPILTLDPDAVWTDAYNRLAAFGPDAIDYLMRQPAITQPAAPDDLQVLLHTSLIGLLADPATAPHLSATCLETTLEVLHFDLKVGRRTLGAVAQLTRAPPRAWHELYPTDFEHFLAAQIDLEADRRALCAWWATHRDVPYARRPLQPRADHLWPLLARRQADAWQYEPAPRAVLCTADPHSTLLEVPTWDYNLVRAACVWLGVSSTPGVQDRLIELVASPLPTVARNARFALHHASDERIRAAIERYQPQADLP